MAEGAQPEAAALAEAAWRALAGRGDRLRKDGLAIDNPDENKAVLEHELAEVVTDTMPIWRRLGVI